MSRSIERGDVYECIKNVVLNTGVVSYTVGLTYKSEIDCCITDNQGNKDHYWDFKSYAVYFKFIRKETNKVEHPNHYTWLKKLCGIEVIDITRHLNFNIGNVIKYCLRAGHKSENGISDKDKQIEDLKKAAWYINDEIKRLEKYE